MSPGWRAGLPDGGLPFAGGGSRCGRGRCASGTGRHKWRPHGVCAHGVSPRSAHVGATFMSPGWRAGVAVCGFPGAGDCRCGGGPIAAGFPVRRGCCAFGTGRHKWRPHGVSPRSAHVGATFMSPGWQAGLPGWQAGFPVRAGCPLRRVSRCGGGVVPPAPGVTSGAPTGFSHGPPT